MPVFSPPKGAEFPAYRHSPTGETKVFNNAADVPPGWTALHPKDPNYKPAPPAKAPNVPPASSAPLTSNAAGPAVKAITPTRAQSIAALHERNVTFDPAASNKALYAQLTAYIEENEA